ncbi:substrate-binding periplasmic protein [Nitrospirillum pindoramense]|uniref:Amino acid ABC transporter substrate-binding protein (PAAT family) n=1 Tax=Nitrospirillum amazonense TaxID=28077 RepID=A0A560H6L5_9PROT|nr:transporter substrate-binding domain-containing protein [Nitrospirillum amazonense]TWB41908.1 amino acid ABC transporter substrate-binding protein (PAAT family) [Nitrospirillum amazonense]
MFPSGARAESRTVVSPPSVSRPLVFGILETEQPPLVEMRDGVVTGGLVKAIGDEIAQRTGFKPIYRLMPRNRFEGDLANGLIDLACGYSPDWLPKIDPSRFSVSLLTSRSVLVVRGEDADRLRTLSDLAGRRVGAILGFHYPAEVESAFIDGTWQREDAPTADSNFRKLRNRRVDAILTTDLEAEYRQGAGQSDGANAPRDGALAVLPQPVGEHQERCANGPASPLSMDALNAAVDAMRADGTLTRLRREAAHRAGS